MATSFVAQGDPGIQMIVATDLPPRHHLYWLLPVTFVVHDAEELFTMPAWVTAHQVELRSALSRIGLDAYAGSLPTTFAQAAVAIALVLVAFLVVTMGVWLRSDSFAWRTLYGGLLGAFLLHTLAHVAQALAFGGYTPGLVTALFVVAPVTIYLGISLLRRGALDLGASAVAGVVGFVLFVPGVLATLRFSRWLVG